MNVKFDNISIVNSNLSSGKQVGIIGEMQGGYVHNVKASNINAYGKEGIGGIIGAVTGGVNYISQCQFDNSNAPKEYVIASKNKYAGGIVGNCQKNSDQERLEIYVENCIALGTIGDGQDAGGNTGGIIGRVKNETSGYKTYINNCYYKGTIIAKGQYNAGILGDLDNGAGLCEIYNCFADAIFIYNDVLLDATKVDLTVEELQTYAHKNSNPIVGRATLSTGEYITKNNYGTWSEYYKERINSTGYIFHSSYGIDWVPTDRFYKNSLGWDLENIFEYNDTTKTIRLR